MKKWKVYEPPAQNFAEDPNTSPIMKSLLSKRGFSTAEEARDFLLPSYDNGRHDPFLLSGMKDAVLRIGKAIEEGEKMVIFADYDADGIPGAVILSDYFEKIGHDNFEVYIPHRYEEGFGMNHEAIERFSENGASLIITIDCGSTDFGEVEKINDLGLDVIITDHHRPSDPEPEALAFVNPNKEGDEYPFKGLSGAGVAFKLVEALLGESPTSSTQPLASTPLGWEKWLLDMAGLATLSDMVPLVGENRVFAKYGMKVLRKSNRPGLRALFKELKIDQKTVTEDDITFMITPRLNAASRMGDPIDAFRLLSTKDPAEAVTLAKKLNHLNNERKGFVAAMIKEANKKIEARSETREVIVVGDPHWRPGLAGLAAQKLSEDHAKPVFVWGREGSSVIRGSCRSVGECDVVSLMEHKSEHFIEYGGHSFAGGFSVSEESVHTLEEELSESFMVAGQSTEVQEVFEADARMELSEVNEKTWGEIEKLSPFGEGNPKPVFIFENVLVRKVKHFGKQKNHLEVTFAGSGSEVKAIKFFSKADDFEGLKEGAKVNLAATMEKSYFIRPEVRLRAVDIL